MSELRPFDPAEYLDDPETIATYLGDALEDSLSEFLEALGVVARAKGMTELAKASGVTRPALYRSLSAAGDPDISTIMRVLRSLGVEIRLEPAKAESIQLKTA